ncbi:MAG: GNAT family N-acetyltransferase [Paramuribaculum sp.]|nr:GNAT family N-acetyltransferase [Paramuribaculum sp.]MDE6324505.1 GNAT family N-acetyltransferase [Paramuribaculum sp.]MDE6488535.1 GNAT family N-acetyltransferase [Paramuribaculum sp.]
MQFRKATLSDFPSAAGIIRLAVEHMLIHGRTQWDMSYPTDADILNDITDERAFVLTDSGQTVVAYGAVSFNNEPAYNNIEGDWLSDTPYVVVHRLAVAPSERGHGYGRIFLESVETLASATGIGSFRIDTNNDNTEMLSLLSRLGFEHCGTVNYDHGKRMAFEKLI